MIALSVGCVILMVVGSPDTWSLPKPSSNIWTLKLLTSALRMFTSWPLTVSYRCCSENSWQLQLKTMLRETVSFLRLCPLHRLFSVSLRVTLRLFKHGLRTETWEQVEQMQAVNNNNNNLVNEFLLGDKNKNNLLPRSLLPHLCCGHTHHNKEFSSVKPFYCFDLGTK